MPKNNVVIAVNGTEQEFISAFIKSVMNESAFAGNNPKHTLKCEIGTTESVVETDAAGVDAKLNAAFSDTSKTPKFVFTIDGNAVLEFTRASALSNSAFYAVTTIIGGVTHSASGSDSTYRGILLYANSTYNYSLGTVRIWKYQIFSNDNVLYLVFGAYNETLPLSPLDGNYKKTYQVFSYTKGTEWAGSLYTKADLYDANGISSTIKNRLEYVNNALNPTAIEVIENKVAVQKGGSDKTITMDNIWDSSFNSAVMFPVNIDNNEYVYVDNYTLMPI